MWHLSSVINPDAEQGDELEQEEERAGEEEDLDADEEPVRQKKKRGRRK